ncbi:MAG: GNAT family N-acetyltransferase [Chloroflexota bacterium]
MEKPFESHCDGLTISTDLTRINYATVMDFLSQAYWAQGRTRQRVELSFRNSLVFGVYDGLRQVGMARVVTDTVFIGWLCDVYIHEDYRSRGIGKWLLESIFSLPECKQVRRWILSTDDAHNLYTRYGFKTLPHPEHWMERLTPFADE